MDMYWRNHRPRPTKLFLIYLAAADVMITDHSSAGFEYLLVDRPLIRILGSAHT